jgi:hypothetical protein
MSSKRQFLDPIGAGCRLILLYFPDPSTKIRISDHTIQLVSNDYTEKLIYRPWIYGDSRDDICVLYPAIIRFIELYLIEKKQNDISSENVDEKQTIEHAQSNEKCHESLGKMAKYVICGLSCLEKTYGYDNATFNLHYFSNLLAVGVNGTYSNDRLPVHLKDSMSQNLLDVSKIKNIWSNALIIQLVELFEKCFDAHKNESIELLNGFKAAIHVILTAREEEFKKIVLSTDSA